MTVRNVEAQARLAARALLATPIGPRRPCSSRQGGGARSRLNGDRRTDRWGERHMSFGSGGATSGIGMALSGGGLRAILCHWGALLRPCSSLYVSGLTAVMLFLLPATPTEAQARGGLTVRDRAFTDEVIERAPRARFREVSLGPDGAPARIWFWFAINCTGRCLESLPENRKIDLEVHWYYDTGGSLTQKLV